GDGDVISRSARFRKPRCTAAVIVRTRCNLYGIASRRKIEGIIRWSTRTSLTAGVGIAATGCDIPVGAALISTTAFASGRRRPRKSCIVMIAGNNDTAHHYKCQEGDDGDRKGDDDDRAQSMSPDTPN